MAEIENIPVSDLLLDTENPRLAEKQRDQQVAAQAIAEQQGDKVIRLAEDIVEHGLDPMTLTGVVATGDRRKRYKVMEGNRRIVALRALETPTLISPVLSPKNQKKLGQLSARFADNPVERVPCVLFASEEESLHWIELRHTGENNGIGLVPWEAIEKDRFSERHAGVLSPAGQIIDFVRKVGKLSPQAASAKKGILTNVDRIISSPEIRDELGIGITDGEVVSFYSRDEVAKPLTRIVEDLLTEKISVPDIYHVADRKKYMAGLPRSAHPKKSTRRADPVSLSGLGAGKEVPKTKPKPRGKPKPKPRTTVIRKDDQLEIEPSRINGIYNELLGLNAETYPNACSVLLRVFVELSVDHYIESEKLMTDDQARSSALAKKLKAVAKHLRGKQKIPLALESAVKKIADSSTVMQPKLVTWHQYVHNKYVYPAPSDLFAAWDELAPFMKKLWP